VGVRVGVAYSRNKLVLRTRLRQTCAAYKGNSFRDIRVHTYDFLKFSYLRFFEVCWRLLGVKEGVEIDRY